MGLTILFNRKKKFSRETPHLSITNQLSMIDSAISKRQGDREKHSFLDRKKYCIKGKIVTMSTQNITSLDESGYEAIHSSISQIILSYLKMFSIQCRKSITVEDNKKIMNITNFINKYINKCIYLYYMWQKWLKSDSINLCYWQ